MKIICVSNQKGGVGKTTTAMNLGVGLARRGKRVLMIDSDPQGNLTSYLGVYADAEESETGKGTGKTLDELFLAKKEVRSLTEASEWITKTESGVDLVASDAALSGVEFYLFSRVSRETILSRFLKLFESTYDFVLIDTPPSINLLTLNALSAATHVLVPVQPEFFGLEGIVKIRKTIEEVREKWNPNLALLGVLPTQVNDRRKLTQEVLSALKQELGNELFETAIHENAAIAESSGQSQSIMDYQKTSRGAADYESLCREVLKRI